MKRILGVVFIVIGLILLYFGWGEYDSLASDVSETFTGSPTDNAVWYLTGGGAATVLGILLLVFGKRK